MKINSVSPDIFSLLIVHTSYMEVKRGVYEKEMAILKSTERAMIRGMCGVKLMDTKNTEELIAMLGLEESLDRMAKASSMRWYGHVLRTEENNVLLKALHFELLGRIGRGQPKQMQKKQIQKEMRDW